MIRAIAAMAQNRVIGNNGQLPWHLSEDLKRFKKLTSGQTVVMGRTTWESLPRKPLPDRTSVVLSSAPVEGAIWMDSIDRLLSQYNDFWVIGGATVYEQLLPFTSLIELTLIKKEVQGDRFFPVFEPEFELIQSKSFDQFDFLTYKRCRNFVSERD